MNGNVISASEYYPDGGYSGDAGTENNPWCISDYKDLKYASDNSLNYCFILTNDIDLSEFDISLQTGMTINIAEGGEGYFDFNGFSFINLVVRSYHGSVKNCFTFLLSPYSPTTLIKPSIKNLIFANSTSVNIFNFGGSYNNTRTLEILNGHFEIFIVHNSSAYPNESPCRLFSIPSIVGVISKNLFLKISGRESTKNVYINSKGYYQSAIGDLFNITGNTNTNSKFTDTTIYMNDYIIVFGEDGNTGLTGGMNGIENYSFILTPNYTGVDISDTLNFIGNINLQAMCDTSDTAVVRPIKFFKGETNFQTNSLINCTINIKVSEGVTRHGFKIYDNLTNKIFINKDRIPDDISFNTSESFEMCTTEQLNDPEYLLDKGMIVFDTDN